MSKKASRTNEDTQTSPWVIAGLVAIALLVVAILIQAGQQNQPATLEAPPNIEIETGVTETGVYYRGSKNAKIVVAEYEDLRCPFCQRYFLQTEPLVLEQFVLTGLVREEVHIIPLLGNASVPAAEAARCAGDQNKFWEFRHMAFTYQPDEGTPDGRARFIEYAQVIGLDVAKFTECFDTQRHKGKVQQSMAEAQALGVRVTPTLIINGTKYEGMIPFEREGDQPGMKELISEALVQAGGQ